MTEVARPDCEALLAQASWVRELARHLTADGHAADDLAQDALAAALVRPPPGDRPLRTWLAGIVRNLARAERRGAENRAAREQVAARAEATDSGAEARERFDTHRAVVEAVARLEEPYRTAILLRYFEGLSPRAIASRTATPLRTVHTRLQRALAQLREELDRAHGGDRGAWLLALIPIARGSSGGTLAALGALAMEAKLKLALVVAVVGIGSTLALWRTTPDLPAAAAPRSAPKELASTLEEPRDPARVVEPPRDDEHRVAEVAPSSPIAPPPVAPAAPRISGRVLDVERAPVAGIDVRYGDPAHGPLDGRTAKTGADGRFELEDPHAAGSLDVASPGWTCVLRPEFTHTDGAREFVLVVARSLTLAGSVRDEDARPLATAEVAVLLPFDLRAGFDAILDVATSVDRSVRTDADGRFELANVPIVAGAKLATTRAGYLTDERALPAFDDFALAIVLRAAGAEPRRLRGVVVDLADEPVPGAWVGLGDDSTQSGPDGEFVLELMDAGPAAGAKLRAVKAGHLPGELVLPAAGPWPDPLVLRLGGEPLAIRGRVLDAAGEPVADAEVWSNEETRFGYIAIEGGERTVRAGTNVEGLLRGDPWRRRVKSDADGRFELTGLLPRDYRLFALDPIHLGVLSRTIAAGTRDVELRFADEELEALVAGRVTTLGGEPLAGVEVVLSRELAGLTSTGPEGLKTRAVTSGADGAFAFERVVRAVGAVEVHGEELGLLGFRRALRPDDDLAHLELAVPLRVHVRVEAAEARDFDRVTLLDAAGEPLELSVHHGKSSYAMAEMQATDGTTEPFTVAETARTLVLYARGVELRRIAIELVRGELNTLRP